MSDSHHFNHHNQGYDGSGINWQNHHPPHDYCGTPEWNNSHPTDIFNTGVPYHDYCGTPAWNNSHPNDISYISMDHPCIPYNDNFGTLEWSKSHLNDLFNTDADTSHNNHQIIPPIHHHTPFEATPLQSNSTHLAM
jgi:hypothetical protein